MHVFPSKDETMSFKCGWQAGGFFAVYIGVIAFVIRIIFGDHSLAQAGIEATTVGLYSATVYTLGYYLGSVIRDLRFVLYIVAGAVGMWLLGDHMNAVNAASFTSTFFLVLYAGVAGLMAFLGVDDEHGEAYMNWLAANDML